MSNIRDQKPKTEDHIIPVNHWAGRLGYYGIVLHIMQGTMNSTEGWFNNAQSQVSSNYAVARDGRLWQFVQDTDTAWANGVKEGEAWKNVPFLAEHPNQNPNSMTVSIECEGNTGQVWPEAQYQKILAIVKWLCDYYGIPKTKDTIIGHYRISPYSRPSCPGSTFPWDRLFKDLNPIIEIPQEVKEVKGNNFQDPLTGYWVVDEFADYYAANGGLAEFGRPISGATRSDPNYQGQLIQWFERERLELHVDGQIYRGLIGVEAYRAVYGKLPEFHPVTP